MLDQHARGRIRRGKANEGRAAPVGAGQVPGKACAAGRIQGARLSGRLRLIIGVQHVARFGSGPHGRLDRVRFRPKLRQEHGRAVRGRADRVVSDVAWRARPVRRPPRAAAMPIGPGRPAHGLAPESCGCQIARQRRKRPRRLPPPPPATADPSCRYRSHSRIRRWRSPQPPNPPATRPVLAAGAWQANPASAMSLSTAAGVGRAAEPASTVTAPTWAEVPGRQRATHLRGIPILLGRRGPATESRSVAGGS